MAAEDLKKRLASKKEMTSSYIAFYSPCYLVVIYDLEKSEACFKTEIKVQQKMRLYMLYSINLYKGGILLNE